MTVFLYMEARMRVSEGVSMVLLLIGIRIFRGENGGGNLATH